VPAALVVAALSAAPGTRAQYTNPYTGRTFNNPMSSYADTVLQNMQAQAYLSQMAFSQLAFNQMMLDETRRRIGKQRIASGKASTRFTSSAKGAVAALAPGDATPEQRARAAAARRACLDEFHAALRRFGLVPHDVADGRALAFVMAYTAYRGQDPGAARLKALRAQYRKALLGDPRYQGTVDEERQQQYERIAIPAVVGLYARQAARSGDGERRAVLVQTAERMGEQVLKSLWGKPVEGLELAAGGFGDRGARIAGAGAGRTTFRRDRQNSTVAAHAVRFGSSDLGWNEEYYADLLRRFDAAVQALGLKTNDVADANAAAAAVAYRVYTGGKTRLNPAQVAWLRREMRKDVLGSPDYQRLSDAKYQEIYETIGLRAMHIAAQYDRVAAQREANSRRSEDALENVLRATQNESNARLMESSRQSALALLEEIFSPRRFDDYVLTESGFRKK